ncbi:hypothetical protein ULMA_02030 [Patiriisocius marinus]|uniref:Hemoglobin n=1 Tax=Patiriisocius marinus TaxID=1397112 RepID=A0A5J4ILZ5_9FLAO|nr:group III truncated hemoglobin [Patiriisocius marinus]GER58095.1 hypothetical protein ULMA_02030 [Patiriisocius marinus]
MKDITSRADIELLVNSFYFKVKKDPTIGYIFNDVAKVNWDDHLPKMYSFWESILFNVASFKGNPMSAHIVLSKKTTIASEHFDKWLLLWEQTIDAHFKGERASNAKQRGKNIAGVMLYKIQNN